jgi:hypothetical protein
VKKILIRSMRVALIHAVVFAGFFLVGPVASNAEEVRVFACKWERHTISRYAVDAHLEGDQREIDLQLYRPGKQVGVLDTGRRSFESIFDSIQGKSALRFFAGGFTYILKTDGGKAYILFFEYEPGYANFDGLVFSVGKLSDLGSKGALYVGSPYDGNTGTDRSLLKQLRAISDRVRGATKQKTSSK